MDRVFSRQGIAHFGSPQELAPLRLALVGTVPAEILQRVRHPRVARRVRRSMESLPFIEIGKNAWRHAGEISAGLRRKGLTIPLSDIIIASAVLTEGHEIFTIDPHFEKIPGLTFHNPTFM